MGMSAEVPAKRLGLSLHFPVVLRLVLPKGSLERATFDLFEAADLPVTRLSAVDYKATIDDPRIDDVRILRPQEIPRYVAEGLFDLGITGRDWVEETGAEVVSLGQLAYSKATSNPIRVVVAVAADAEVKRVDDLPNGVRVSTEYPELTRRYFEDRGVEADIRLSYGASEAKIPDIADCIVDITETGRALRAAGLRILDTILVSHTELVANPASAADPAKRHAMGQLLTLLLGALEARDKVLVKLNVADADCERVLALLPSMKSPTMSSLAGGGFAVETVVEKRTINTLIPDLKDAGATDILELPLSKIVH
jgi:ATP phosphoribosyltransferase